MKNTLLLLFISLAACSVSAQGTYTTSCEIRNGTAYGSVQNFGNSFEVNGYLWFSFYDTTGRLIGLEDEYEYEYISAKSTEEIEYTSAPANACRCTFDVSKAITTPTTAQPVDTGSVHSAGTSCDIRNGTAYGSVQNLGSAYEINGSVWFYFYDCNGKFLDSEDEYEYEYVSARSTEEIEHTSAPTNACRCTFDVSKAVTTAPATQASPTAQPAPTTTTTAADSGSTHDYSTSCEIRNGTAYGSVNNFSSSFEIDGTVWFYFYSCDGSYLAPEDEYEYEYVSAKSTEEIEYTSAPAGACRCTFEVKGAIKN